MQKMPDSELVSIVMLGSFNPAIFQPHWLGAHHLIRPEEAENAKIRVIQAEVADFSTDWFKLQVLQNRFQLVSEDPRQYGPLRDLSAGIFAILSHTPIKALGMNRSFHFSMPSVETWHQIGHQLAPKEHWNEIMETPGLRSMLIQGHRKQPGHGLLHIKVEPSTQVKPGLFVEVNEEFRTSDDSEPEGAAWVCGRLSEHWDEVLRIRRRAPRGPRTHLKCLHPFKIRSLQPTALIWVCCSRCVKSGS